MSKRSTTLKPKSNKVAAATLVGVDGKVVKLEEGDVLIFTFTNKPSAAVLADTTKSIETVLRDVGLLGKVGVLLADDTIVVKVVRW